MEATLHDKHAAVVVALSADLESATVGCTPACILYQYCHDESSSRSVVGRGTPESTFATTTKHYQQQQ